MFLTKYLQQPLTDFSMVWLTLTEEDLKKKKKS